MRNPTYAEDFQPYPKSESVRAMDFSGTVSPDELPTMFVGIRTITHNRSGVKLHPAKVVVIEMRAGDEIASMDLDPRSARIYAVRLAEYADAIDGGVVVTSQRPLRKYEVAPDQFRVPPNTPVRID